MTLCSLVQAYSYQFEHQQIFGTKYAQSMCQHSVLLLIALETKHHAQIATQQISLGYQHPSLLSF